MQDLSRAIGEVREGLAYLRKSEIWSEIVVPKEGVLARFGPLFHPNRIASIAEDDFRSFLYFDNNHHWSGLYRQVNRLCRDMAKLRATLSILVDESRAIESRLDTCGNAIIGLGPGIMTAILTVAFPDRYGVWNGVSEEGLLKIGVWPEFGRGTSLGAKYLRINSILSSLKDPVGVDFWTLDAIWWQITRDRSPVAAAFIPAKLEEKAGPAKSPGEQSFGLERHLQDFLYDNWDRLEIGKEWVIYAEPGAPDAGYEYTCGVGRIDILAKHRDRPVWLVIELKRDDTSDSTVGQVLRYMGWVRQHLAHSDEEVHGLIIARSGDAALHYAVAAVPNLKSMSYSVEFRLQNLELK